jgi:threonyl-tRNA synthetase
MQIFKARPRSHRELPLRFAELGAVYRYEASGALHGLLRVRGFVQDDAHLFCAPEQAEAEVADALAFALELLSAFGFDDVEVQLSNRPAQFVGEPGEWDAAVESLARAARLVGREPAVNEGGGAFYGPKLDVQVRDAHGRAWQCSSVQYDFNLPARFDLAYVAADGQPRRPVVIHRALFGSLERFFALLLEHHAGALPGWLSPEQLRVLPVDDPARAWANEVAAALQARGVRAAVDASGESLGRRIRSAEGLRVPYLAVVGAREVANRSVSLRRRGRVDLGERLLPEALGELVAALAPPPRAPRR